VVIHCWDPTTCLPVRARRLAAFARHGQDGDISGSGDVETIVRARLRSLRRSLGWSLDHLAERSQLSASTISRIETGKRTISLDILIALADALEVDVNSLVDVHGDDDIIIRPVPSTWPGVTVWPLSRPTSRTAALKMRLEPTADRPEPRIHPGHDWLFVLAGRLELTLGGRRAIVDAGEAAEFSTMTPHSIDAIDAPAEFIMIVDRDGRRDHSPR
jgi:transcriptional regulator with XRE-family HTH domain